MAQWARANAGAFAAASRLRWDRLRDEFAAWRASVNNVANGQLAGGVTFPTGYLAADRSVSRIRFWMHEVPFLITPLTPFEPDNIVRPVGAHRFAYDAMVREATLSIATGGNPILIGRVNHTGLAPWTNTATIDPDTLDHVTFRIVRFNSSRAAQFVTDLGVRNQGEFYAEGLSVTVAGPINVSNIYCVLEDNINNVVVDVKTRYGDAQVDRVIPVPFNVTSFLAGDILVGVIETPRMKNPGGLDGEHHIYQSAMLMSFSAQYEQVHRS